MKTPMTIPPSPGGVTRSLIEEAASEPEDYPMFLVRRLQAACGCGECDGCAAASLLLRLLDAQSEHTCHDMNPPFPGPCAACAKEQHESKVEQSLEHVLYLLDELYALVNGECPSLLDEDRGGDASLDAKIARALLLKGTR